MSNVDKKMLELKSLVEGAELSLQQARKILDGFLGDESAVLASEAKRVGSSSATADGQVIEGLFDGQNMLGPDGKRYSVPANYASKSKLVEGDGLKLTIMPDGSFVYKQINLLERDRLVGVLAIDEKNDEYRVVADGKSYKVLTASITYYKGEPGARVTILVPKGRETAWAAVENVYKAGDEIPGVVVNNEIKAEELKPEAVRSIFDEVKLSEMPGAVPSQTPVSAPAPASTFNDWPSAQPQQSNNTPEPFLSEEKPAGVYGPTAPEPKAGDGFSNFLSEEKAPTDGLGDKDKQGLEEL